jgi:hypothetical protein
MKLVRDTTGRFRERPHYELDELEEECERTAFTFLEEQYGQVLIPIPTNALVVLIEQYAEDLDLFADLSGEGAGVQGVTEFFTSGKPQVRIARELSKQFWRAHRLRTTLAHEYGHVLPHARLWAQNGVASGPHRCLRQTLLPRSTTTDWMEWQAGYVSGALLMPRSRVKLLVEAFVKDANAKLPLDLESEDTSELKQRMSVAFDVSSEAAGVRLLKLGHLSC